MQLATDLGGLPAPTRSPRDLGSHESRDRNLLAPEAKIAISSLLGASATGLPRFADVLRTCTMMVQEIVTMIVTMGLRVKAQTPAAQRMTRKSS